MLFAANSMTLREITAQTRPRIRICFKWRKRFLVSGPECLRDKQGLGRSFSIPPDERVALVALACTTPSDGSSRWSVRKLAEVTGRSNSAVQKILGEGAIKSHKSKCWRGKIPDPEFKEKQAAILNMYLNSPENDLVLCVDEKSQIQARDHTQSLSLMRLGNQRLTATCKRSGTTCPLAVLALHAGTFEDQCVESSSHGEFLNFLKELYKNYNQRWAKPFKWTYTTKPLST
jgi:putative transposase